MKRSRVILAGLGGVGLVAIIVGGLAHWWLTKPLYEPGEVRARTDLGPPAQPEELGDRGRWKIADRIELAWFARGQGRPVLVVHGGPGLPTAEPWPLADLYDRFRFYYWAQRGCGESSRPFDRFEDAGVGDVIQAIEPELGIGAQLADIERIRRILGEERLLLVGHSFGGLLAALYATEFPEHVDRMVLLAPADVLVLPPEPENDFLQRIEARLPEEDRAGWKAFVEDLLDFSKLPRRSEAELVEQQRAWARYFVKATGGDLEGLDARVALAGGWVVPAIYVGMGMRHDWRGLLRVVDRPALVVHGTEDLTPPSRSETYVDALPNAELTLIEGAGHFPQQSHPTELAEILRTFLSAAEP